MQKDGLCNRCQDLEAAIEDFEEPITPVDSDRSHQEIIPPYSFDPNCRLCLRLSSLFRACAIGSDTSNGTTESHELLVKCRYYPHPDLERLVAYHRLSYRGRLSYVFLKHNSELPLSIVDNRQADFERIRHWFHHCKTHHEYCKSQERTSSRSQIALKAIDCTTRRICNLPSQTDYICLSYVWGSSKDTPSQSRAGIGRPLHNLPKTIEDAIHVTLQLGMNFLWVDRYCIDQRNPNEKHEMISNMDQIYLNATFTIIAAEGDGPHAGLPGVCGTPRKRQRVVRTKRLELIGIESVAQYVQNSKWNTRGWTYQEMLLSRRVLLFTDTRVYFQCLTDFALEGVTGKVPETKPVFPILQGDLPGKNILNRLSEYFERSLSFPADTVRAIFGIFNALNVSEEIDLNQFYGMPVVRHAGSSGTVMEDFVERLTWIAGTNRPSHAPGPNLGDNYGLPNTDLSTYMPGAELNDRTKIFPSWSWAAFKADCPKHEQAKGIKLIFPCSHKHGDKDRSFDPADTEVRIYHRNEPRASLCNFVQLHHDFEDYHPYIDITAWTWTDMFSTAMLKENIDAYNICLHLDDSHTPLENELTAIHTVTYKTKCRHEEEFLSIHRNSIDSGMKLTRVPSNPHERCYHIRMLLVKYNGLRDGSHTYARVGILTVDTKWRGVNWPDSVGDILEGLMRLGGSSARGCWEQRTLRLV